MGGHRWGATMYSYFLALFVTAGRVSSLDSLSCRQGLIFMWDSYYNATASSPQLNENETDEFIGELQFLDENIRTCFLLFNSFHGTSQNMQNIFDRLLAYFDIFWHSFVGVVYPEAEDDIVMFLAKILLMRPYFWGFAEDIVMFLAKTIFMGPILLGILENGVTFHNKTTLPCRAATLHRIRVNGCHSLQSVRSSALPGDSGSSQEPQLIIVYGIVLFLNMRCESRSPQGHSSSVLCIHTSYPHC